MHFDKLIDLYREFVIQLMALKFPSFLQLVITIVFLNDSLNNYFSKIVFLLFYNGGRPSAELSRRISPDPFAHLRDIFFAPRRKTIFCGHLYCPHEIRYFVVEENQFFVPCVHTRRQIMACRQIMAPFFFLHPMVRMELYAYLCSLSINPRPYCLYNLKPICHCHKRKLCFS